MTVRALAASILLLGFAITPALAHTGVAPASGFAAGFGHPLGGLDHILAMVAVGLLAAGLGGRWLWVLPLTFVGMMIVGGVAGMVGVPLPVVELGIQGSVVVLGLAVAVGDRCPPSLALAFVAVFALFHGHAHGTEMPGSVAAAEYGLGFIVATALLHLAGIGLGLSTRLLSARVGNATRQAGGAAIAALGLFVFFV